MGISAIGINTEAPADTLLTTGVFMTVLFLGTTIKSTPEAFAVLKQAPTFLGSCNPSKIKISGASIVSIKFNADFESKFVGCFTAAAIP